MNHNQNANTLQDLVQLAHDGAVFYTDAATAVKDPVLVALFQRMAKGKTDLATALGGRLQMIGENTPGGGTLGGSLRKVYTDVRAMMSSHDAKVYVDQLEQSEDRLLANFKRAIATTDNDEIRSQLQAHLPAVQAAHDEMRGWKRSFATA